ncbi:MAG: hypothetical protein IJG16_09435 [Clostridia bacterium]|nr:hypothetical protein [Clostridia bacterium]
MIKELTPESCENTKDKYLYIISHFEVAKQSEFAILYAKIFQQKAMQSTIAHNFKRFNIVKSTNGFYTVGEVKKDKPDISIFCRKYVTDVAVINTHTSMAKVIFQISQHGLEEELCFLLREYIYNSGRDKEEHQLDLTTITPNYQSVTVTGFVKMIISLIFNLKLESSVSDYRFFNLEQTDILRQIEN